MPDDTILLRFQFYTYVHKCPRIAKSFQTSLECISSSSDLVIKLEFLSFSFTSRFVRRCFLSKRPSLHKHYLASSLSGRKRRQLNGLPLSAAQTGRAVFPHPAFTRLRYCAGSKMVLDEQDLQVPTRHKAWMMAVTSSHYCAIVYGAVTKAV